MTGTPSPMQRRLFPKKEAAHYLGISIRSLEYLVRDGHILQVPLCGRKLYDKADLDALIDGAKRSA